jgi:hypothetical protein
MYSVTGINPVNQPTAAMNATQRTEDQAAELLESMIVSFVNQNAEKIKALAAFQKITKAEIMKLKEEFMASIA